MNEKENTPSSTGGLQRSAKEGGGSDKEVQLNAARKKRVQIKEGHLTGGYCDSEELVKVEKEIHKALSQKLEAAKEKHGYSPDPKFKHPEIRAIELELNGLAYKPVLVVTE